MIAHASNKPRKRKDGAAGSDSNGFVFAPLYSAEAERAVLGSMMARPDAVIDIVCDKLKRDDFFVPAHQTIFETVTTMHNARQVPDMISVHQSLVDTKMAEAVGSPGILAELAAELATHLNVGAYVKIVKDKSMLRRLQTACADIVVNIADKPDQVSAVLDQAEAAIFHVTNQNLTNTTIAAKDEIDNALKLIESFKNRKGKLNGIPTGFHRLDELTTGWQKGDMVVLAARPGVGKTALALTFAMNALKMRYNEVQDEWVKPGYAVGMFSLEMTNEQLLLRMLANAASESLQRIRQGDLDDQSMKKLRMIGEDLKDLPLYLDDSSFLTINQLRGKARRMKDRYNIDMLLIDYLQLLRSDSDQAKDNRQNEVSEISRGIKGLAKELSIPIIVLAQLNRKSEEGKAEPALHNLRESGAIEQDADMVMLLHRPEIEEGSAPPNVYPYILNIAKQRSGPTDRVELLYKAQYTRFDDPARHEARPV